MREMRRVSIHRENFNEARFNVVALGVSVLVRVCSVSLASFRIFSKHVSERQRASKRIFCLVIDAEDVGESILRDQCFQHGLVFAIPPASFRYQSYQRFSER